MEVEWFERIVEAVQNYLHVRRRTAQTIIICLIIAPVIAACVAGAVAASKAADERIRASEQTIHGHVESIRQVTTVISTDQQPMYHVVVTFRKNPEDTEVTKETFETDVPEVMDLPLLENRDYDFVVYTPNGASVKYRKIKSANSP